MPFVDPCCMCTRLSKLLSNSLFFTQFQHVGPSLQHSQQMDVFAQQTTTNRWSIARLTFHPAGGLSWARYAPSRGLPAMRACMYRRRCPVASWVDLECLRRIVARDLHVDSAMLGADTWSHGAMPMPGQHVGAYPHGYLLTIGG